MANSPNKTHPSARILNDPGKTPTGATTPEDIDSYLRSFVVRGPQRKRVGYVEQKPTLPGTGKK